LQTFEPVEEMLMSQIANAIRILTVFVITVIAACIVQRKWGSKGLLWVWIASVVVTMGATLSPLFYKYGLPKTHELFAIAFLGAFVLVGIALVSGGAVWFIAVLGPHPPQIASAEVNYFPYTLPIGKLEDTYGLAGILRRYHELLATFLTDLDTALASTLFNPYRPRLRDHLRSFRVYSPSYLRQVRADSRQFRQVPNALMRDLAGADVVLGELEMLTAAQLSAIEECHRANVRRLRQRSIFRWSWQGVIPILGLLGGALVSLGHIAEKIGGVQPSDFWPLIRGINLTGANLQSFIILEGIVFLGLVAVALITNFITFLPILRRAQAFEDILTIAKAYRKGLGETTKPSAEPSLTVTR
jgi:hypothetical protein